MPVKTGKVEISSTFENVSDASPSYPRRCWDVPVAYDDMETRLKSYSKWYSLNVSNSTKLNVNGFILYCFICRCFNNQMIRLSITNDSLSEECIINLEEDIPGACVDDDEDITTAQYQADNSNQDHFKYTVCNKGIII